MGGGVGGKTREGASSLPDSGSVGTGGDEVACLATVGTKVVVSPATALFGRERTAAPTRTVNLHWTGARGKREGLEAGGRWLLLLLWATLRCSRLIVLDGDGSSDVRPERGRHVSPSRDLKTNRLFEFAGKKIDASRIILTGNMSIHDVLEKDGQD